MKTSLRVKCELASHRRCRTLVAILENPDNFINIASVIRNIDALGVSKLYIVSDKFTQSDFPKPGKCNKSAHVSKRWNPAVSANQWVYVKHFATTKECIDYTISKNYTSLVTSPHMKDAVNLPLLESDFTVFSKLAIWFGAESTGISQEALANAKGCIQIEMAGIVESLNLSVCTGIVLHFIASQRRTFSKLHGKVNTPDDHCASVNTYALLSEE